MEHRALHMSVHCRAVESFHSALRRRVKVARPNLYTFLGHLQRATADSETEIARLNRGMSIRRCKKRTNLVNDARIKSRIARYDSGAYTRVQFLRAVMGLLQLRYEHDSTTIRVRYNILRGVMCFRAIMNMSILSRCCRML